MRLKTTANPDGFPIIISGATITVCPMSASALSRLRQKHTTVKRGVEQINGVELSKEMFDRVVLAWDDTIQDEFGAPLACTTENKRAVAEHNSAFVGEVLTEMEAVENERRIGEEGNLPPGPSGTSSKGK